MPTGNDLSLQELAAVADVTPRTIRYYIAQGLLPAPDGVGPAARYADRHLARLRLIRQLQREHLPLAEIRSRLTGLADETIAELLAQPSPATAPGSAIEYVRELLARTASPSDEPFDLHQSAPMLASTALPSAPMSPAGPPLASPDRSQWDRIALTPDIELHVRRPLGRLQNRRVDRLIVIARELLEEDPS